MWPAWRTTLGLAFRTYLPEPRAGPDPAGTSQGGKIMRYIWNSFPIRWVRQFAQFILAAPVLTLGSIHLSMMGAIGIWLWRDPAGFGKPIDRCTLMLTVFSASVSINSTPLRIFSLTMYALILIPGLNLLPPFAFFLFLHISYNHIRLRILGGQDRRKVSI